MKALKSVKIVLLALAFLLILDSCSSAKSRRGCDGNKKARVPFGYM